MYIWDNHTFLGEFLGSINLHKIRVVDMCWLGASNRLATLSMEQLLVWEQPGQGTATIYIYTLVSGNHSKELQSGWQPCLWSSCWSESSLDKVE